MGLIDAHGIKGADVASVTASVPPLTHRLIGRPVKDGLTSNYARLSGPYTAARLLLGGELGLPDFLPDALADPATHDLGRRIVVEADDNPDPNALTPIRVTVGMRDGTGYTATAETVYGNPRKPMSREAHLRKFRENLAFAVGPIPEGNAEALIALIDDLETLTDVRRIVDLLVAA